MEPVALPKRTKNKKKKNTNKEQKLKKKLVKTDNLLANTNDHLQRLQLELKTRDEKTGKTGTSKRAPNAYEALLLSLAMPKEYPPLRLGAGLGSYQTAVANPFEVVKPGWGPTISGSPATDLAAAFVFRDPFRHSVIWMSHPGQTFVYGVTSTPQIVSGQLMALSFPPIPWVSGPKVHGDALFPGRLSGSRRNFLWLQQGHQVIFQSLAAGGAVTIAPNRYNSNGTTDGLNGFGVLPLGSATFSAATDGYYGFDVTATSNLLFTCTITINSDLVPGTFGHRAMPYGYANSASMDAVKMYAASLTFTNIAAPVNRQGKLAAAQLPRRRDWRDFVSYDAIASVKDAYVDTAVDGYYGFLKPTQYEDLNFIDQNEIEGGRSVYAYFNLETPSDYLALSVSIENPLGQDAFVTVASAIEYRTNDQFREVRYPDISSSVVNTAMNLACRLPQHHENPFHIGDIWGWIKDTARDIWDGFKTALPPIVDTAEKVARIGGAIIPLL